MGCISILLYKNTENIKDYECSCIYELRDGLFSEYNQWQRCDYVMNAGFEEIEVFLVEMLTGFVEGISRTRCFVRWIQMQFAYIW